jgi:nucleoid-associated protein Lsr2
MADIAVKIDDLESAAGRHVASTEENPVNRLFWAYDGTSYQIDLTVKNRAAFDKAVEKYLAASQEYVSPTEPSRRPVGRQSRKSTGSKAPKTRADDVRAWAATKGIKVSERGRVPREIWERWEKETGESYNLDGSESHSVPANGSPAAQHAETGSAS